MHGAVLFRSQTHDQRLAALFYHSGWTQEQLAKKEGKTDDGTRAILLFGRRPILRGGKVRRVRLVQGESYRLKEAQERADQRARQRRKAKS